MDFTFKSNIGKRERNEDSYGNYKDKLFLVADGLGGHPAGEVASKVAVETAVSLFPDIEKEAPEEVFKRLFERADKAILEDAKKDKEKTGMGTTIVGAIIEKKKVYFGNVGDSRGYLLRDGKLELISTDDRDGLGFLTRSLGVSSNRINVHVSQTDFAKGDMILLCSDGLTDFVKEPVIEKILRNDKSLDKKATGLVEAALQFDGSDNITVCLVSF